MLTPTRKDEQAIIHVDPEDQEDLHRRRNIGQGSSSSEEQRTRISSSEEQRTDHPRLHGGSRRHLCRRCEEIFCIVRGAAPRSSTSTDTIAGGSIFCYFNFASLQSRVVPVWVGSAWMCLNTGSSVLTDCKFGSEAVDEGDSEGRLQRISSRINHIDGRGSRKALRLQGSAAGSTTSSSEHRGELLHHPTEQGRSSTSVPGPTEPQVPSDPGRIVPHFGPIGKEKQHEVGKEKQPDVGNEKQPKVGKEKQPEVGKEKQPEVVKSMTT